VFQVGVVVMDLNAVGGGGGGGHDTNKCFQEIMTPATRMTDLSRCCLRFKKASTDMKLDNSLLEN
jgi:hypothetical protein